LFLVWLLFLVWIVEKWEKKIVGSHNFPILTYCQKCLPMWISLFLIYCYTFDMLLVLFYKLGVYLFIFCVIWSGCRQAMCRRF
jgi:hypothetical protein